MDDGMQLRWEVTSEDSNDTEVPHKVYMALAIDRFEINRRTEVYCPDCNRAAIWNCAWFNCEFMEYSDKVEDLVGLKHFIGGGMEVK